MSIAPPRLYEDSLYVSAIGNVSAMIELNPTKPAAKVKWRGRSRNALYAVNVAPFMEDGVMYGCDVESSALIAAKISDGQRLWETKQPTIGVSNKGRHGTAFIIRHENGFYLFSETGDLIHANLTPEGYQELGRAHLLEPTNEAFGRPCVWSHPAFANRSVFARNDKEIVCASLDVTDY